MTRAVMVTLGAPSAEFLRGIGQVSAGCPMSGRFAEVGARHGPALVAE